MVDQLLLVTKPVIVLSTPPTLVDFVRLEPQKLNQASSTNHHLPWENDPEGGSRKGPFIRMRRPMIKFLVLLQKKKWLKEGWNH